MNNIAQPAAGKPAASTVEETHWSITLTLWIAAALLGMVISFLVWLFIKGFDWLNGLPLDTFGALPAPTGQIATALIPAIGGLLVAFMMHAWSRPDKFAAMANAGRQMERFLKYKDE